MEDLWRVTRDGRGDIGSQSSRRAQAAEEDTFSARPPTESIRGWWDRVLAPDSTDKVSVESAIFDAYSRRGQPPDVIWCGSPLAVAVTAGELPAGRDIFRDIFWKGLDVLEERSARFLMEQWSGLTDATWRALPSLAFPEHSRSTMLQPIWDAVREACGEQPWSSEAALEHRGAWNNASPAWGALEGSVWTEWTDWQYRWEGEAGVVFPQTAVPDRLAPSWYLHECWGFPLRDARPLFVLVTASGGFVLRENTVLLSERHSLMKTDGSARLHSESGPAMEWPDGFAIYAWHGVRVPADVINAPHSLEPAAVLFEPNVEVRRAMIERLGYQRFLQGLSAQPVASDDYGKLWRIELEGDEPIVVVELENATDEQDGTRKRYFLRIPPHVATAREAAAWTFNVDADECAAAVET